MRTLALENSSSMDLQGFDKNCLEILEALPNRQSKHCFRSAINHLKRAEPLFAMDRNMAVFRCITAEEEAASGLMYCLKDKRYKNSERLNPRDHVQKNAVLEFFSVLSQFVEDSFRQFGIEIILSTHEKNGAKFLAFQASMDLGQGQTSFVPDPPLNFCLTHEDKRFSYKKQIEKLRNSKQLDTIAEHLKVKANLRNLLLYANQRGFPCDVEIEAKFFPAHQRRILALLRCYLMIAPYEAHQQFVQDSLDSFLLMLEKQDFSDIHNEL